MEKTILIVYLTKYEQSYKVAQYLAKLFAADAQVSNIKIEDAMSIDLASYDFVIVGASILYGRFPSVLYAWLAKYHKQLSRKNNAFYGINLVARKDNKNTPQTNSYMLKFAKLSPWQPQLQAVFAGALRYSKYKWYDKAIIRFIMKITGGNTDTSKDIEYTDWKKVDDFARQIIQKIYIQEVANSLGNLSLVKKNHLAKQIVQKICIQKVATTLGNLSLIKKN